MKDRMRRAFDDVRADDALLEKTTAYLREEREKRGRKRSRNVRLRMAGMLASALVLVVGIIGYRAVYATPAVFVSMDVNPSVELTLNRMDKVIDTVSYNADGEALLGAVSVSGKPYGEAVSLLLREMEARGYLSGKAFVTMTVQATDDAKEQRLCDALLQAVTGEVGAMASAADVEVFPVTREVRERAHGCHMSAAKYLAIQELMEVDDTATLEEYSDSSLHAIRQRTGACHGEHGNGQGGNGHSNGHGHGGRHGRNGW